MTSVCLSCTGEPLKPGSFRYYYSYSNKSDYHATVYYTDEYFDLPSTQYQPSLATASLSMAMAGFASNREAKGSYQNRFNNGKEFLESAGFENVIANQYYQAKPTTDSFGTIIGNKKLGDKTLIAITVRGGNYEQEWASNCTLGLEEDSDYAAGFHGASDIYLASLRQYIVDNDITGPIKLWTAGYSRGGATVNMSIGRLDEELLSGKQETLPGVTYQKEDLYAYCFEPPAGGSFSSDALAYDIKGEAFSNIHCIVNLNDPVPFVAPKEWNFCRYGNEYYLSDFITDLDHPSYLNRIKSLYSSMENADVLGPYLIDSFDKRAVGSGSGFLGQDTKRVHWTQGRFLSDFVYHLVAAIGSRNDYAQQIQPSVRDIFSLVYSKNTPKDSVIDIGIAVGRSVLTMDTDEVLFTDLMHAPEHFFDDLRPLLRRALEESKVELDIDLFLNLVGKVINAVINIVLSEGGLSCIASLFAKDNVKRIAQGHRPELCLAHMMAMDPNYGGTTEKKLTQSYYVLRANTNVGYRVKHNGNVLAAFENGAVALTDSSICYGVDHGEEVVYLPSGNDYEIEFGNEGSVKLYRQSVNASGEILVSEISSNGQKTFSTPDMLNPKA